MSKASGALSELKILAMQIDHNIISDTDLKEKLKNHFGFENFLPNQEEIIQSIISGQDTLAIMPTGGGKSMCFQLPAICRKGTTIVISPLIALMKDQVDALRANGISAAYFNSSQPVEAQQQTLIDLENQQLKLLYVAPESLPQLDFILKNLEISLFAIDEAHCISVWGHDFRPAYKALGRLKQEFPHTPIIALTATADRATREDILHQLNIHQAKTFISSFDRPNLYLDVRPGRNRKKQIIQFLKNHPNQSGIIYCLSRKGTEGLAAYLSEKGFQAEAYHAGMDSEERNAVQENFILDKTTIIVATIAFGMGIDKSNVRWVIHYNMPKNIEGYYQEIGRSGRDGLPADTLLFHSYADVILLRKFAEQSGTKEIQLAKLERMQQFSESLSCRRRTLLSYFGEHLIEDCGNCDICTNPPQFFDGTILAQKICSAVARLKEQESVNMVVDVLRGAKNAQVYEKSYHHIKTYGAVKDVSWRDLQDYVIQLINQGVLEIWFHERGRLVLTPLAKDVLFKGLKINLAHINQPVKKVASTEKEPQKGTLFLKLRELRMKLAQQENVPPYVIFSDASLDDMVRKHPKNKQEFSEILGVGRVKLQKYADDFLAVIKTEAPAKKITSLQSGIKSSSKTKSLLERFVDLREKIAGREGITEEQIMENSVLYALAEKEPRTEKAFFSIIENPSEWAKKNSGEFVKTTNKYFDQKIKKTSSHQYSYQLYTKEKLSVEEIAHQRGLGESTVINHFIKMHEEGHSVDFSPFITTEEIKKVQQAKKELKDPDTLKEFHDYFMQKMPYHKIKLGLLLGE